MPTKLAKLTKHLKHLKLPECLNLVQVPKVPDQRPDSKAVRILKAMRQKLQEQPIENMHYGLCQARIAVISAMQAKLAVEAWMATQYEQDMSLRATAFVGTMAHRLKYEVRSELAIAAAVVEGLGHGVNDCAYYQDWLHVRPIRRLTNQPYPTPEEARQGRLMWIDALIEAFGGDPDAPDTAEPTSP